MVFIQEIFDVTNSVWLEKLKFYFCPILYLLREVNCTNTLLVLATLDLK